MKKLLFILLAVIPISMTEAQMPKLNEKEISGALTLIKDGYIKYYPGAEQIIYINPDLWNMLDFTQRKGIAVQLCVYVNRYVSTYLI